MIRIITDSSTLYTQDVANELQIDVVPLTVTINNQSYREFIEIDTNKFYEIIKQGHIPTSSQPPIGDYLELFDKYKEDEVIVITMADGLSGTYQSCLSAKQISEHPRIKVINSKTLCVPHRLVVKDAIEMRDQGHTFDEIVSMIETKCETSRSFLLPQDFEIGRAHV